MNDERIRAMRDYELEEDGYINELEIEKSKKIEELEILNSRLQDIVGRGSVIEYDNWYSTQPNKLNIEKGEFSEAFSLLGKILFLTYEIVIKIPRQQKKYLN